VKQPFSFDQFFAPPRDMTPTITAFVRPLLSLHPAPREWFVDEITFAILRDEGRSVRRPTPYDQTDGQILMICGVRIVEFQQPT
jgi:hypothetical protein